MDVHHERLLAQRPIAPRRARRELGLALAVLTGHFAACTSDRPGEASGTATAASSAEREAPLFFGDEAAFERNEIAADSMAALTGAGPHTPEEPDFFDALWVAREAHDMLERAKRGELTHSQVRTANGTPCLVFDDRRLVRRMLIGSGRPNEPLEEMSFGREGKLILWFRSDRADPTQLEWAYFHRGANLALYQSKLGKEPRVSPHAPAGLDATILSRTNDCLGRFGATNPQLQAASGPPPQPVIAPPAPQPVEPTVPPTATVGTGGSPEAKTFGAIAYSEQHKRWGVSAQRSSDADARRAAVVFCGKLDCAVQATFGRGQCAVVVHTATGSVSWGWGKSTEEARGYAVAECAKRGGGCVEQGRWCNDP